MTSVLLKGSINPHALLVMECFREANFNNGKPGLVMACANVFLD